MATINFEHLVSRNVNPNCQHLPFLWWPIELRFTDRMRYGWLRLPGHCYLSFGLEPDYDERLVYQWGALRLTRPETTQEQQDREEAEAEEAFMERELNRYTEWHY